MNKTELTDAVAESTGMTKADAARAVDSVLGTITSTLAKGEQVGVVGFGTFLVRDRAARTGRNPQTGQRSRSLQQKFLHLSLVKH